MATFGSSLYQRVCYYTSNVLRMSFMFYSCNALTSLNLSGFDTSNVLYMSAMFIGSSTNRCGGSSPFTRIYIYDCNTDFSRVWGIGVFN
ncbi:MAG: BspA family leucine-rich repeat surface protein [Lachnospira sp.]|nr:BspA family leucine-rich repeat surface protein [Lachnospira sp.]